MIARLCRLRRDDERGSLAMAMLISLLVILLGAAALPTVISLAGSTRDDQTRVSALHAAETGLQVAIGKIRAARDSSGAGDNADLPCGSPVTGPVTGTSGASYAVTFAYFDSDPRSMDAAGRAAAAISCAALPTHTPAFVGLTSTGTSVGTATQSRVLLGTYAVSTNNQNIPGGLIQNEYDGASSYLNLCLDAGSATPVSGQVLKVQICQTNVPDQQRFSYRKNLTLVLNSSVTSTSSGMCLQADPTTPRAGGVTITFQPCMSSADPNLYLQQWSYNDSWRLQAANSNGSLASYCFGISSLDTANVNVVLDGCNAPTRQDAWIPSPAAGAGMAGPGTDQVVNFKQFGRCIDLANWDLNSSLIAFPCKQTPTGTPGWNQRWLYNSVTKTLSMDADPANHSSNGNIATPYCAISPATGATGSNLRVKVGLCPDPSQPTPAQYRWTDHTAASDLNSVKYTYSDTNNRCLMPSPTDFYATAGNALNNISWIVVGPCDGSLLQKWNADPTVLLASPLKDVNEAEPGS